MKEMEDDGSITLLAIIAGFIICLLGTLILLSSNIIGGAAILGLGLIIVAVFGGFIESLFDMFTGIFSGLFGD
jgi:hypothetical protein